MYIYISYILILSTALNSDIKLFMKEVKDLGLVAQKFKALKRLLWGGHESQILQETWSGRVKDKKHFLSPNT